MRKMSTVKLEFYNGSGESITPTYRGRSLKKL